jgi:MFS family permease
MPTYLLVALLLVPTGLAQLVFTSAANAAVQLGVDESVRGRVMGLYILLLLGSTPIGGPVLGWMAETLGGRSPLVLGGLLTALTAVLAALWAWHVRRRTGRWCRHPDPHGHSCTGTLASMPAM